MVAGYDLALTLFKALIVDAICREPAVSTRGAAPGGVAGPAGAALAAAPRHARIRRSGEAAGDRTSRPGRRRMPGARCSCVAATGAAVRRSRAGAGGEHAAGAAQPRRSMSAAVATGLRRGPAGRAAARWRMIVGRDPERLDEAGVARAAVESLAENSDGVVAPAVLGCRGGSAGHPRLQGGQHPGQHDRATAASATARSAGRRAPRRPRQPRPRPPHRRRCLCLVGGAPRRSARGACWRDARAAPLAERRLAGGGDGRGARPRARRAARYGGVPVEDALMGDGRAAAAAADIGRALAPRLARLVAAVASVRSPGASRPRPSSAPAASSRSRSRWRSRWAARASRAASTRAS